MDLAEERTVGESLFDRQGYVALHTPKQVRFGGGRSRPEPVSEEQAIRQKEHPRLQSTENVPCERRFAHREGPHLASEDRMRPGFAQGQAADLRICRRSTRGAGIAELGHVRFRVGNVERRPVDRHHAPGAIPGALGPRPG